MKPLFQSALSAAVAAVALAHPLSAQRPAYEVDTLEVRVASRASPALPAATRAVQILTADALRAAPVRSVADALQWALGLDVMPRSPAQADVAMRGSSFEQVLVLVDGVRMSDAQSGHFDLNLAVPLDQVERIEVLRGVASTLYGTDAVGGVVNIVTRAGGTGAHARVEAGSFGGRGVALGARTRAGALRVDGAIDHDRSDGHRPGVDHRATQARLALALPLGGGRELAADLGHGARDFGAAGFYGNFPAYEETRVSTASLALRAPAASRLAVEPRLSFRRHDDDFVLRRSDPSFYRNLHTSWQYGGELVGRFEASPSAGVAVGGELYRDELESTNLGDRTEDRGAVFAEAALGRTGSAALTAGVRHDAHSRFGGFTAPSLAAAWWPAQPLRLRASAGRAFRAPSWTERHYRDPAHVGNPELQAERSWGVDGGVGYTAPSGARLELGAFVRRTDSLIDWARPSGRTDVPYETRNVASATFRGLEVEARLTDPSGTRWTAHATALDLDAADEPGFDSKYALRPLTRSWALGAERAFGTATTLALRAHGARRAGETGHRLLDARLAHTLGAARLHLDTRNITGTRHVDIVGQPAAGRVVQLGVEWRSGN